MKVILTVLFFLLAVILQTTSVSFLAIFGVIPNLVLIMVLVMVLLKGFDKSWKYIILIGFLLDLFSGLPFGLISLGLVSSSYLIDSLNRNVFSAVKFWIMSGLVALGILVYNLFLIGSARFFNLDLFLNLRYLIIEIIYDLLFAFIFFYVAKKIFHKK
ncbi:MAG: rod shape-determining protein MreD [bacterium]